MLRFPLIYSGDTWPYRFNVSLAEGAITDCTIRMQIREKPGSLTALLTLDSQGNGIAIVSATAFEIEMTAEQTAALPRDVTLFADVEFTLPNGKVATLKNIERSIAVQGDVTKN